MNEIIADLSIPLRFNGPQPNAWGVEGAMSRPVEAGDLVGDTRRGGSVNFEQYTLIPHCSATHTECVGHITHDRISIRECLRDVLLPSLLVTVEPESGTNLTYPGDRVITRNSLAALGLSGTGNPKYEALIVRTRPNGGWKQTAEYGEENIPAYFAADTIDFIVELGVNHLLVDLPSIDRIFDDGKLANHRKFWNVEPGSYETNPQTRLNSTITELIYVPDSVADGEYVLNLQIAPFESDCAPSRPVLLRKR
jgi:arylformamidase